MISIFIRKVDRTGKYQFRENVFLTRFHDHYLNKENVIFQLRLFSINPIKMILDIFFTYPNDYYLYFNQTTTYNVISRLLITVDITC